MADSSATLALARSPPNAPASAWYRSPDAGRLREGVITGERGEHPRLELGRVRDHQHPAGIRNDRAADHPRNLQRAAAAAGPPARNHSPDHVLRVEPAAADPFVQPGPAVRRVQPGQLLVFEQNGIAGWSMLPEHARAGGLDLDAVGRERLQQLCRGVGVDRAAAERGGDLGCEVGQPGRPEPRPGPAAEQAGQQGVVHVSPPRHAPGAHLGCGQAARGLHRGQQAEPGRVGIRGDPAQLVRVHTDQRPEDLTRLGDPGLGRAEQRGLPGGGWPARRARGGQTRAGQTCAGQAGVGPTVPGWPRWADPWRSGLSPRGRAAGPR